MRELVAPGPLPGGRAVYRCHSCGADFLSGDGRDRYWDTPGQEDIYADPEVELERAEFFGRVLDQLGAPPAGGRLLDVGAGKGEFALLGVARGWDVSVVEPSARATEGLVGRGVSGVFNVGLEEFESENEYDCVSLLDVLEHLSDPMAAMERAARCLKAGGTLVALTPDGGSLIRKVAVAAHRVWPGAGAVLKYQYYHPHLCYLSARALAGMASRCGLAVVKVRRSVTPRRFLQAKLKRHYGKYPGSGAVRAAVAAVYPLAGATIGNKLLLFARKIA